MCLCENVQMYTSTNVKMYILTYGKTYIAADFAGLGAKE